MLSSWFPTTNQYINYRIEINENSIDKVNNTSEVTVKVFIKRTNSGYETYGNGTVYVTIDGVQYTKSITSSQIITDAGLYLFDRTVTVTHDGSGAKDLTVSSNISHSRFSSTTHSATLALTVIPRASTLTVPANATLGQSVQLTIVRKDSAYYDTITWQCGDQTGTVATMTHAGTVSVNLPASLSSVNVSGEDIPVTFFVTTYTDSTGAVSMGTNAVDAVFKVPASVVPTASVTVSDTASSYTKFGVFLQGFSQLSVTITASGQYGASIVDYSSTVEGKAYTGQTFVTETIMTSGSLQLSVTVRDSRGRTNTITQTLTVVPYDMPMVSDLSAERCEQDGTPYFRGDYCKVTFSAKITSINSQNEAEYYIMYKSATGSTFSREDITIPTSEDKYNLVDFIHIFPLNNGTSYNIYLYAEDEFTNSRAYIFSPSVFRLAHFGADGRSIAFLKQCEEDGADMVDLGGKIRMNYGYGPGIIAVEDLDDLDTPGFYTTDMYLDHAPFDTSGYYLEVRFIKETVAGHAVIEQYAESYSSGAPHAKRRYRTYASGEDVWSTWHDVFTVDVGNHVNETVNAIKAAMLNLVYPVGSIYISVSSTSPATLFGGTWQQIQNKFLLASGDESAGDTGGAKTVTITGHTHTINTVYDVKFHESAVLPGPYDIPITNTTYQNADAEIDIMPPYIVVNVWKRTA